MTMSKVLTNRFQAVRIISLASWRQADEISPRDPDGPYLITQEGCGQEDGKATVEEFVLGRAGKWLPLGHFLQLSVMDRRAGFVFGTTAEIMQLLGSLPAEPAIFRPAKGVQPPASAIREDEMAAAYWASKAQYLTAQPDLNSTETKDV
jgi:hypothetical protein